MIDVYVAKVLGFCFGVRRAIDIVEAEAGKRDGISTLGQVVHNPRVVAGLNSKGAKVVSSLDNATHKTVAITAHGTSPEVIEEIKKRGFNLIDATCPIVSKAQREAKELADAGFQVIIYGEANHPEVRGVVGWTKNQAVVTLNPEEDVPIPWRRVVLLSQTTKSQRSFSEFVGRFVAKNMDRINELRVVNTTCPETDERYEAAREMAPLVEMMIVIGGKNSANTRKLAEVTEHMHIDTYHIEKADEINPEWLTGKSKVGVTAGASTPDADIDDVISKLKVLAGDAKIHQLAGTSAASSKFS